MIEIDGLMQIGTTWTVEGRNCDACGKPGVELAIQEGDTIKYYHVACAVKIARAKKLQPELF